MKQKIFLRVEFPLRLLSWNIKNDIKESIQKQAEFFRFIKIFLFHRGKIQERFQIKLYDCSKDIPNNPDISDMSTSKYLRVFRIVVVGGHQVGKTSIINRFVEGRFLREFFVIPGM